MEYILLRGTDLKVSRIGFGCCPMGGHGWGNTCEKDFSNAVSAALDLGVNFFDTADVYGLGLSEKRLGSYLKNNRKNSIIATKFGVKFDNKGNTYYENSKDWLREALNSSLKRLQTDYIDLYQVHYWDSKTPMEEVFLELEKCKKEGKIREYGVTNINPIEHDINVINSLATYSYEYSLVNRTKEFLIKEINKQNSNLLFIAWGSLGQGILSGKYVSDIRFSNADRRKKNIYQNFHEKFETNLKIVNDLKILQNTYRDKTISQLSIRWLLDFIPSSIALVGIKRPEQIIDIAKSVGWCFDKLHVEFLELKTRISCEDEIKGVF